MSTSAKATRIDLFSFSTPQMRAFHLAWMAFFVSFFAWFALAPLMPVIKGEFGLNKDQIGNINIAAVAVTILVRLIVGPLCDKFGPRRTYTWLLLVGAIPVLGIAFVHSYMGFLLFRLAIGGIGASFVITQYHTSVMFAPNVVGTANATTAGWGNAGGGVTQTVMPLILAMFVTALVSYGFDKALGWRVAMIVPGTLMILVAIGYWKLTQDTPEGDIIDLRKRGIAIDTGKKGGMAVFIAASKNYRVWMLAITYAACFGVEITIHNVAALYYTDVYKMDLEHAGMAAGSFGLLALFARALGGIFSDKIAKTRGLDGRTKLLFFLMIGEGIGLLAWSQSTNAVMAVSTMLIFGLFTHMACGSTYSLVPFIDRKSLGGVAGIIGAGGNVGAVGASFLLKGAETTQQGLQVIAVLVLIASVCAFLVRFSPAHKAAEQKLYDEALAANVSSPEYLATA